MRPDKTWKTRKVWNAERVVMSSNPRCWCRSALSRCSMRLGTSFPSEPKAPLLQSIQTKSSFTRTSTWLLQCFTKRNTSLCNSTALKVDSTDWACLNLSVICDGLFIHQKFCWHEQRQSRRSHVRIVTNPKKKEFIWINFPNLIPDGTLNRLPDALMSDQRGRKNVNWEIEKIWNRREIWGEVSCWPEIRKPRAMVCCVKK